MSSNCIEPTHQAAAAEQHGRARLRPSNTTLHAHHTAYRLLLVALLLASCTQSLAVSQVNFVSTTPLVLQEGEQVSGFCALVTHSNNIALIPHRFLVRTYHTFHYLSRVSRRVLFECSFIYNFIIIFIFSNYIRRAILLFLIPSYSEIPAYVSASDSPKKTREILTRDPKESLVISILFINATFNCLDQLFAYDLV